MNNNIDKIKKFEDEIITKMEEGANEFTLYFPCENSDCQFNVSRFNLNLLAIMYRKILPQVFEGKENMSKPKPFGIYTNKKIYAQEYNDNYKKIGNIQDIANEGKKMIFKDVLDYIEAYDYELSKPEKNMAYTTAREARLKNMDLSISEESTDERIIKSITRNITPSEYCVYYACPELRKDLKNKVIEDISDIMNGTLGDYKVQKYAEQILDTCITEAEYDFIKRIEEMVSKYKTCWVYFDKEKCQVDSRLLVVDLSYNNHIKKSFIKGDESVKQYGWQDITLIKNGKTVLYEKSSI